jgi:hypothetical protein
MLEEPREGLGLPEGLVWRVQQGHPSFVGSPGSLAGVAALAGDDEADGWVGGVDVFDLAAVAAAVVVLADGVAAVAALVPVTEEHGDLLGETPGAVALLPVEQDLLLAHQVEQAIADDDEPAGLEVLVDVLGE